MNKTAKIAAAVLWCVLALVAALAGSPLSAWLMLDSVDDDGED